MKNIHSSLKENPLEMAADEAYVQSQLAVEQKLQEVDRLINSSVSMTLLVNFLSRRIEEATNRADFEIILTPDMVKDFNFQYNVLTEAITIICQRHNYSVKLRQNGELVIGWKTPRASVKSKQKPEGQPFQFEVPKEFK